MAVHLHQSVLVDKTDLLRRNADNWTVLVMQVQNVLMPPGESVSSRSPELCEPSCCRSGYVTERVYIKPINDLNEDDMDENEDCAFQPDVV